MAFMLRLPEILIGIGIVAYILNDLFQSVVVPRPTPGRYRPTRWVVRPGWRAWRAMGLRARPSDARESFLGALSPPGVVIFLVVWLRGLVLGFCFIFFGLREYLPPAP